MDPTMPILFLLTVAGFFVLSRALDRPHTVVRIEGGAAEAGRGTPLPALLRDLGDAARGMPAAKGRLELRGEAATLKVDLKGFGESDAQRLRNVTLLHRSRIRAR